MKLAWMTDPHLEHHKSFAARSLGVYLGKEDDFDALVISGDISNASRLLEDLEGLVQGLSRPVYFVLGNHDFYGSSIKNVKESLSKINNANLKWLDSEEPVSLTESSVLCGVGGFYDIEFGLGARSTFVMPDFERIEELSQFSAIERLDRISFIKAVAAEDVSLARAKLEKAVGMGDTILFCTHYPPFKEACRNRGGPSSDFSLPFFTWKGLSGLLLEFAESFPEKQFHVLCGHTHTPATIRISENLVVSVGKTKPLDPEISRIFALE